MIHIDHTLNLPEWGQHIVFPLVRWLHVVCTCALVGGTLFYEFVIPKAIEDQTDEAQLGILGRVRWIFRTIVIWSTVLLIITGIISTWRQWDGYRGSFLSARRWFEFHAGLGVVAMAIAVWMTLSDRVPRHPIRWLRFNIVILLIVIFLSAVTRYVRLTIREDLDHDMLRQQQFMEQLMPTFPTSTAPAAAETP